MAQLLLVALLIAVVVTAVAGSAPASRPASWTPFAPHGWLSVGRAAATLMLSFVGWEAVAPLTGRLRAGQLSRVIGIAFTVTAVLYLGLAVATISCLGRGADLSVPLADLLQLAIGPAGRAVAAAAALVLTAGSVNAYLSGATEMLRELTAVPSQMRPNGPGRPPRLSAHAFLGFIALAGLPLIGLSALRLADTALLVSVPTAMFLCVYLSCTASAVRILAGTGPGRSRRRGAGGAHGPGLLRLGPARRRRRRRGRRPARPGYANARRTTMRLILGSDPSGGSGSVRRTVRSSLPRSSPARTVRRRAGSPAAGPGRCC